MQRKFILIFADFILFLALPLFANMSRLEMRERLLYAEHEEIEKMQASRLNKVEIGEWQEIIEDAIFALVRRSELYRGHIKIVVFQDRKVVCKIYPDLSVFISSGLLEYIDDFLFSSLSDNLRRAKNINADREECLATFLSFGVSRFALDIDVEKYASTGRLPSRILEKNDIFLLDKMAAVFLKVAGYRSNLILEHFERLKKTGILFKKNIFKILICA